MRQFIDSHAHAYRKLGPFVPPCCTAEQLIKLYDQMDVARGVLLPFANPEIYFPQTNEEILEMAEQYPDRFIPFCNIDPRVLTNSADAPLESVLRYYRDKGCKGLGEIMPNLRFMDPLVQNLFKHAEAVGLPVTFDGSDRLGGDFGLYDDPGLPQLEHTLQRFPELVLIGHGPTFWVEIGRLDMPADRKPVFRLGGEQVAWPPAWGPIKEEGVMPKLLRRYPNLYGELSNAHGALARDPEYGPMFLTEFQDRLLFGMDIVFMEQPVPVRDLLLEWRDTKKISETVFNKIARGNAIKLLKLA